MKLFWRIFLSFFLATILMIAAVLGAGELFPLGFPGDHERRFQPELAVEGLTRAVNDYEQLDASRVQAGIDSLAATRHVSLHIFDPTGKPLIGDGTPPRFYAQMVRDTAQDGHAELKWGGFRALFVCPIQSETGQRYITVLTLFQPKTRVFNPRYWVYLTIAMFPAALVCMLLSLYLSGPITRLRTTAQRLASGDLNARAAPLDIPRGDEIGELARDFDRMAAQIQALMSAQRRFVADVSHELGAPLTRMHLALALLRRQLAHADRGELARIERETDKLSNLVQQLLLMARMEAGSRPVEELAPVSLNGLCDSIVEDANFEAAQANCLVTGSREEVTTLAYPQLLRQAIDNVLRNALRYAPAGSEIELDCRVDEVGANVIIAVSDAGPGVPQALLKDIFRPFFRTASGREETSGGTGLGLAIASEAMALHEGTITARNRTGGGLEVTMIFPLKTSLPAGDLRSPVAAAE
jgi:two-component system sensor histidine kinase CpxA